MSTDIPYISQSKVFMESEGDGWFERNKVSISSKTHHYETDFIKRTLQPYNDEINNILEIGCGNGVKLRDICRFFNAAGSGIDPSDAAVNSGNSTFTTTENLKLDISTASKLPYKDSSFDLVYFGFCLYLVDRNEIFQAVAEADRVLKNGGYLAIFDFDPANRHKRPYHHKPGIFSYKTSYSNFFTASGHYYLVAKDSFSHSANHFSTNSDERISICILYKEMNAY